MRNIFRRTVSMLSAGIVAFVSLAAGIPVPVRAESSGEPGKTLTVEWEDGSSYKQFDTGGTADYIDVKPVVSIDLDEQYVDENLVIELPEMIITKENNYELRADLSEVLGVLYNNGFERTDIDEEENTYKLLYTGTQKSLKIQIAPVYQCYAYSIYDGEEFDYQIKLSGLNFTYTSKCTGQFLIQNNNVDTRTNNYNPTLTKYDNQNIIRGYDNNLNSYYKYTRTEYEQDKDDYYLFEVSQRLGVSGNRSFTANVINASCDIDGSILGNFIFGYNNYSNLSGLKPLNDRQIIKQQSGSYGVDGYINFIAKVPKNKVQIGDTINFTVNGNIEGMQGVNGRENILPFSYTISKVLLEVGSIYDGDIYLIDEVERSQPEKNPLTDLQYADYSFVNNEQVIGKRILTPESQSNGSGDIVMTTDCLNLITVNNNTTNAIQLDENDYVFKNFKKGESYREGLSTIEVKSYHYSDELDIDGNSSVFCKADETPEKLYIQVYANGEWSDEIETVQRTNPDEIKNGYWVYHRTHKNEKIKTENDICTVYYYFEMPENASAIKIILKDVGFKYSYEITYNPETTLKHTSDKFKGLENADYVGLVRSSSIQGYLNGDWHNIANTDNYLCKDEIKQNVADRDINLYENHSQDNLSQRDFCLTYLNYGSKFVGALAGDTYSVSYDYLGNPEFGFNLGTILSQGTCSEAGANAASKVDKVVYYNLLPVGLTYKGLTNSKYMSVNTWGSYEIKGTKNINFKTERKDDYWSSYEYTNGERLEEFNSSEDLGNVNVKVIQNYMNSGREMVIVERKDHSTGSTSASRGAFTGDVFNIKLIATAKAGSLSRTPLTPEDNVNYFAAQFYDENGNVLDLSSYQNSYVNNGEYFGEIGNKYFNNLGETGSNEKNIVYAQSSYSITPSIQITSIQKMVKTYSDTEDSGFGWEQTLLDKYEYELSAVSNTTQSVKNIIMIDSLETNYAENSKWNGILTGFDVELANLQISKYYPDYMGVQIYVNSNQVFSEDLRAYGENAADIIVGEQQGWKKYNNDDLSTIKMVAFVLGEDVELSENGLHEVDCYIKYDVPKIGVNPVGAEMFDENIYNGVVYYSEQDGHKATVIGNQVHVNTGKVALPLPMVNKIITGDFIDRTNLTFNFEISLDEIVYDSGETTNQGYADRIIEWTEDKTDLDYLYVKDFGTYTFTVKEVNDHKDGFTYSTEEYKLIYDYHSKDTAKLTIKKGNQVYFEDDLTLNPDLNPKTFENENIKALDFTNTYEKTPNPITVSLGTVRKVVENKDNDTTGFYATITAQDTTYPAPGKNRVLIKETSSASLGTITFTQPGTYSYVVSEQNTNKANYDYDNSEYIITFNVVKNNGKLTAAKTITKNNAATTNIVFTNKYVESTAAEFETPTIKKIITGDTPTVDETFYFTFTGGNNTPMPATTTLSITGEGENSFGNITFNKAGTFTYTIKETVGTNKYYTYDNAEYQLQVVVEESNRQFNVVSQTLTKDGVNADSIQFTNNLNLPKGDYEVIKEWVDDTNRDNIRPANLTITLYKNGDEVETRPLNHANQWKTTFENLILKDENDTEYVYTVSEEDVAGYDKKLEKMDTGFKFINTHTPETITLTVDKKWQDFNNGFNDRPIEIGINIAAGNNVIKTDTLTAAENWTKTFTLLKNENGNPISYIVEELPITNYTSNVVDKGNNIYEITNIHNTVKGQKTITINYLEDREDDVVNQLKASEEQSYEYDNFDYPDNISLINQFNTEITGYEQTRYAVIQGNPVVDKTIAKLDQDTIINIYYKRLPVAKENTVKINYLEKGTDKQLDTSYQPVSFKYVDEEYPVVNIKTQLEKDIAAYTREPGYEMVKGVEPDENGIIQALNEDTEINVYYTKTPIEYENTVKVNYLELNTEKELKDSSISNHTYLDVNYPVIDLNERMNIEIDNYNRVDGYKVVKGMTPNENYVIDELSEDTEINIYYTKKPVNHQNTIKINYLEDKTNETLADSFEEVYNYSDENYPIANLVHQITKEIEDFEQVRYEIVKGIKPNEDYVINQLTDNTEINIYYVKRSKPQPEPVVEQFTIEINYYEKDTKNAVEMQWNKKYVVKEKNYPKVDLTAEITKEIKGYTWDSVEADKLLVNYGYEKLDENKVINVYYVKDVIPTEKAEKTDTGISLTNPLILMSGLVMVLLIALGGFAKLKLNR